MLEAGEDPRYVARRLLVTASEDAGGAPGAMHLALAAAQAVQLLGGCLLACGILYTIAHYVTAAHGAIA